MAALDTFIPVPVENNRAPVTRYATLDSYVDGDDPTSVILVLDFDPGATTEFARWMLRMPGQYDGSSALEFSFEWTSEATTGNVKWDAKVARILPGTTVLTADNFATIQTVTTATDGTARTAVTSTIDFTNAEADGIQPNEQFILSLERDSADAADTMNSNDAEFLGGEVRLN